MLQKRFQIRNATIQDISKIVELSKKGNFSSAYKNPLFYQDIFKKNSYVIRVLETKEGIKGVYLLFPLSKGIYEGVLKTTVQENEMPNFLLSYKNKSNLLYLGPIITNIHESNSNKYVEELTIDMRKKLVLLCKEKVGISEIGTTSFNKEDKLFLELGFRKTNVINKLNQEISVYRADIIDVILSKKLW